GNPVAGVSVVFAVATGGGSLTGPTAVTTSGNGLAAVGGWMLGTLTGPNTLTATAPGLAGSPVTFTATAAPGSATQLGFTGQPSPPASGVAISPAVQVSAQDAFGNTVPGCTGTISVALGSNPTGGVLAGGTTVTAVNGVASFADLSLSTAGTSFT